MRRSPLRRFLSACAFALALAAGVLLCVAFCAAWRIDRDRDLVAAILDRDTKRAAELLRAGADPDARNDFHREHISLWVGLETEAGRVAHFAGSEPKGKSALALAIQTRNDEIYQSLFRAGAHVDMRDHLGRTALREAVILNRVEIARDLIARGASPTSRDVEGLTPLRVAASLGNWDVADVLRKAGATKLDVLDGALLNDIRVIRDRIPRDGVDRALPDGRTALAIEAGYGNEEAVRLLLASGANPNTRSRATFHDRDPLDYRRGGGVTDLTPLMWAAGSGSAGAVSALLRAGADPLARDGDGRDPVNWASNSAASDRIPIYRLLLDRGARPDCQDARGVTALMIEAVRSGSASRYLISRGASVALRNNDGKSARDIATEMGNPLWPRQGE